MYKNALWAVDVFKLLSLRFCFLVTSHHIPVCLHSKAVDSGKDGLLITRQGHKESCLYAPFQADEERVD